MKPSEIARSYDQLADHWASGKVPQSNGIEQHKRAIAFLEEKGDALDIGCGSSSRLIDLFRDEGFRVEGLDVSEKMIDLARAKNGDVRFYCASISEWSFPRKYDLVSAWDSIWHLSIELQKDAIAKISEGLNENGVFISSTGGVDVPSEHTDSFFGQNLFYGVLGIPALLEHLKDCGLVLRHFEYDQLPEKHIYLIAQKT